LSDEIVAYQVYFPAVYMAMKSRVFASTVKEFEAIFER